MARKREVKIKETTKELKPLLHQQKSGRIKERVQVSSRTKLITQIR